MPSVPSPKPGMPALASQTVRSLSANSVRPGQVQLRITAALVVAAITVSVCHSAEEVDYERDVKPILKTRCFACHGALQQEASLRLDTVQLMQRGGDSGPAIMAGEPGRSVMLERIRSTDETLRMPPEGDPLEPEQIELIRRWLASGANAPANEQPEPDPRDHWSFRTPVRPEVPPGGAHWVRNPIDAFISRQHQQYNLTANAPIARAQLLRRVSLDLTGLPPTRDALHQFLADQTPGAYERAVDRLLDSPQYGERWGRHWMDVWRYSDWYGRRMVPDVWNSAPQIWRWRDWIVESLNNDKGYHRMLMEMLAGDELAPADDKAGYATGYLIRNWYALNPNDWMRSNVEHTGKAFLGLTFNCAHCHDHKYDPIAQDDYFRFRAFFEPIGIRQDRVPGEADPGPFQEYEYSTLRKINRVGAVRIFDKTLDAPTWFYEGGDERNRDEQRGPIAPGLPSFLGGGTLEIDTVQLPPEAWYPDLRPAIQQTMLSDANSRLAIARDRLADVREADSGQESQLRKTLELAQSELVKATEHARNSQQPTALAGRRSLLLEAASGRRIVQNPLTNLESLHDGTRIRFELLILQDAHVNFQLARDTVKGLTAGYVGFVGGRIIAYQPGTFTEFEAGRYDFAAGQQRFRVELILDTRADRGLLTIHAHPKQGSQDAIARLVAEVPVAINGWNPTAHPNQAISFDARTGTIAAIDDIVLEAPSAAVAAEKPAPLIRFDFETEPYTLGSDIVGQDDWQTSNYSEAPARSLVTASLGNADVARAEQAVQSAQRALDAPQQRIAAAAAEMKACVAELTSLVARIEFEQQKLAGSADAATELDQLARQTVQLDREAKVARAQANLLTAQQQLLTAELMPATDANRAKEITAATKRVSTSQMTLKAATSEVAQDIDVNEVALAGRSYPQTSTGRRLALAEWIGSRENPLTARVAVNHVWMRHFHRPLVSSVFDFGRNGTPPTHPELLDWLAVELIESGWSLKHLHRLMVTSATYRMSSSVDESHSQQIANDPDNRFLWHMNPGRMEAEVVRDSLLFTAGRLQQRIGGQELENKDALSTYRRTLYYSCHPELNGKSQFGALFDAPEATECYRRTRTVIPQQALALTNSQLVQELSSEIADRLWNALSQDEQSDARAFLSAAFEQLLGRLPTDEELRLCERFLAGESGSFPGQRSTEEAQQMRTGLIRVLFNHNDFIAIR